MRKTMVLFVATILLLSAVLAGCPPPFGRRGGGRRTRRSRVAVRLRFPGRASR